MNRNYGSVRMTPSASSFIASEVRAAIKETTTDPEERQLVDADAALIGSLFHAADTFSVPVF